MQRYDLPYPSHDLHRPGPGAGAGFVLPRGGTVDLNGEPVWSLRQNHEDLRQWYASTYDPDAMYRMAEPRTAFERLHGLKSPQNEPMEWARIVPSESLRQQQLRLE